MKNEHGIIPTEIQTKKKFALLMSGFCEDHGLSMVQAIDMTADYLAFFLIQWPDPERVLGIFDEMLSKYMQLHSRGETNATWNGSESNTTESSSTVPNESD